MKWPTKEQRDEARSRAVLRKNSERILRQLAL
jgi:hypothetical protein